MLLEYVKNNKGQRVGVVVAIAQNAIGWSKCNTKVDKFDKRMAVDIAVGRACRGTTASAPMICKPIIAKMVARAERYYKTAGEE